MNVLFALLYKEFLCELKNKQGIISSFLFTFFLVFIISYSMAHLNISNNLVASLLLLLILFLSLTLMPRIITIEKERGTFFFLQKLAPIENTYMAKTAYSTILNTISLLCSTFAFHVFLNSNIQNWMYTGLVLFLICLNFSAVIIFTSLISINLNSSWIYSCVLSLPLLIPQIIYSLQLLTAILIDRYDSVFWQNLLGIIGFTILSILLFPILIRTIYRVD